MMAKKNEKRIGQWRLSHKYAGQKSFLRKIENYCFLPGVVQGLTLVGKDLVQRILWTAIANLWFLWVC
jgi:hypothetical protein